MIKLPAILSAALSVSLAACADDKKPLGQPVTTPLITPQKDTVGTVTVFNSTDGLFITASPGKGWELTQTLLSVGLSGGKLPQTKSGRADLDRFLLRKTATNAAGEISYALPLLVKPGTDLAIALHAELRAPGSPDRDDSRHGWCDGRGHVTAWAQGDSFPGRDGSMYLIYTVQDSAPVTLAGQFRTYSQATWGATSDGKNPAGQLAMDFPMYFPNGVSIGAAGGWTATFTSSQAVDAFLPQTGAPGPLTGTFVNPPDLANPFAGDVLALTLNVRFDAIDPTFSSSTLSLASLVVADPSSSLYGLTVQNVLDLADQVLSGQPSSVPVADLYDAVARINADFEGGAVDLGFLGTP